MFSIECIFHVAPSIGFRQVMFEYKLYPVFFYYYWQTFIWETYIDIADDKGCFKVPLKAEFTLPVYVHNTLARDNEAESLITTAAMLKTCWKP